MAPATPPALAATRSTARRTRTRPPSAPARSTTRPIFAAARQPRARTTTRSRTAASLNDADISFTNLKGIGAARHGHRARHCRTHVPVRRGRHRRPADNVVAGHDQEHRRRAADDHQLALADRRQRPRRRAAGRLPDRQPTPASATPLPRSRPTPTAENAGGTRGTCVVNVGFKPTRPTGTSVRRACCVTSNARRRDRVDPTWPARAPATRSAASAATSTSLLSLTLGASAELRLLRPGRRPQLRHG